MTVLNTGSLRMLRGAAAGCAALLVIAGNALAQAPSVVMLLSQPAAGATKEQFVDLAPHLQPALQESGKYSVVVFRGSSTVLQDAVKSGKLKAADLEPPVSREAAHKIANVLGASGILHVSATNGKDGVAMAAELEVVMGQNTWNQVYLDQVAGARQGGKRVSLLESIHGIVDRIVQKMTTANVQIIGAQRPVEPPKNDVPGKAGETVKPDGPGKPENTAQQARKGEPVASANGDKAAGEKSAADKSPPQTVEPRQPRVNNASTYALLIDRARRNGDMASLIVALRKAINERPHDIQLRRDLAAAYKERGWTDLAKDEILRASANAPGDGSVHRLMGDVLLESGDKSGAIKEYTEAARLTPQDPANQLSLGDALVMDGRHDEALKAFQAAAAADPKSAIPHARIARLNVSRGAYSDAVAALTAARSLVPENDAAALIPDMAAILTVVESTLVESLPKFPQTRAAFNNGTKTREEAFKVVAALRKRLDELSTFLDAMPDVGGARAQAFYAQAASLSVQSADKLLEHLETQSTSAAEESNLLRIEANKQIGEGAKRLKSILEALKSTRV